MDIYVLGSIVAICCGLLGILVFLGLWSDKFTDFINSVFSQEFLNRVGILIFCIIPVIYVVIFVCWKISTIVGLNINITIN